MALLVNQAWSIQDGDCQGATASAASLLARDVVVVEAVPEDEVPALPDEEAMLVKQAFEQRRREFAAGRFCARAALLRLDRSVGFVGRRYDGSPDWPTGIVGSITHTKDYVAAAVALSSSYLGIGIDAEAAVPLPQSVARKVLTSKERLMCSSHDLTVKRLMETVMFSAKESTYKAWGTFAGARCGIRDVEIEIDESLRTFRATVSNAGEQLCILNGRFTLSKRCIVTTVVVPRGGSDSNARGFYAGHSW